MEKKGSGRFQELIQKAQKNKPLRVAVVGAVDELSLKGAFEAFKQKLIVPTFFGPQDKTFEIAQKLKLDISSFDCVDTPFHAAADEAVKAVHQKSVDTLMKGAIPTADLMKPVLHKITGLRTERRFSHVFAVDVPYYHKLLFVSDAALNIQPDLMTKADITQNAIDFAHAMGIKLPKTAILSAIEKVNPKIPATLDAAALCKMADRGQITGAILDGPLAFDNAISKKAAETKHITSKVVGDADILITPDLEAGNMLVKQLEYLSNACGAGVVVGGICPVILTSRSDDIAARVTSCAMAALYAEVKR